MSRADEIIAYGMQEIGKPYVWGAEGPNTFDCSGLMQWIFGKAGLKLPRTAREQQRVATPVTDPRPGDLVFYNSPATHVGLYLGGGRMLHAPNARTVVKVAKVYGSPTYGRIAGAGTGAVGSAVDAVTRPVSTIAGGVLDKLADSGRVLLIAAGGVGLVLTGLWVALKGDR